MKGSGPHALGWHMDLVNTAKPPQPPVDRWVCAYCGDVGTMAELQERTCTHDYTPCTTCGQAPECALDCAAVLAALGAPGVYVAGRNPGGGS